MRLALGFVLAMAAFAGAALWAVRQIEPVVRLGAPLAEVRTVELEVPLPPPPPHVEPLPAAPDPEASEVVAISPQREFVESVEPGHGDDEPAPPPGPVVVAAEAAAPAAAASPSADESAALIRRMLSVYRRTARVDGGNP